MNLRIFDSADDLIRAAARTITQKVKGGARSIALSGGSTPRPLYELLGGGEWREQLAAVPITWVLVDERCVPIDDPESNAGMIRQTLFGRGIPGGHQFLRFRTEIGDPARIAADFETQWRALGLDSLDVVLLGMGDDGHTASLFPGTPVLDVKDRIAAEVFVPRLNAWRVTLTEPVLRAAALRMVLAAGSSKRGVLDDVGKGVDYPVARVTRDVETWWFVDREAAGK
ncbi:MAG TPA: 6-phosphogluconolactonase [Thermoanaerobaculia bacterium]|jgi:6-phosphogluconolactonase